MRSSESIRKAALILSGASLLSLLAREFVDYAFVYHEIGISTSRFGTVTLVALAFFAGWIWALVAASHESRRAMIVLVIYSGILILFGAATMISLCPSPCRTAWPTGEIAIWSNLVIGVPAAIVAVLSARTPTSKTS